MQSHPQGRGRCKSLLILALYEAVKMNVLGSPRAPFGNLIKDVESWAPPAGIPCVHSFPRPGLTSTLAGPGPGCGDKSTTDRGAR